jgi:hypothetical protein
MISKKMLFMPHPPTPGVGVEDNPGRAGSGKSLNMWLLYIKCRFFLHCKVKSIESLLLRFGCLLFSNWHYIRHNSICTNGYILKVNNIYTFKEGNHIDIVRLLDVFKDKNYLYCTLYFFKKNRIATVSHIIYPDDYLIWQIMENLQYDEIMSRRLWREVNKEDDLLEFGY